MTKFQKSVLIELMHIQNDIDWTAINIKTVNDRLKAHSIISKIIYHILLYVKDNPERDYDRNCAEKNLTKLKNILNIYHGDRYGNK